MTEPLTSAEIAELRAKVRWRFSTVHLTDVLRLLDSHEALRQRADAGVRDGMERAAEIAYEAWCDDYATAGMASRLIREAAALPSAAAKDELRDPSHPDTPRNISDD